MIKNEISPKHLIFIKLVAKGMKLQDAYRSIVDKEKLTKLTDSSARTMGSRLGKKYAKEIIAAQKVDVEVIESTARIEKAREVFSEIYTQAQVDARICKLIDDENKGVALKAMEMYNKRFGSYSPEKQRIETAIVPQVLNWNPETNGSVTQE